MVQEDKQERKSGVFAKKSTKILIAAACVVVAFVIVFFAYIQPQVIKPMQDYNKAVELLQSGEIDKAEAIFKSLGDYKDSEQQIDNCDIARGDEYLKNKEYEKALNTYSKYEDNPNVTEEKTNQCKEGIYQEACSLYEKKDYASAKTQFEGLGDYSDSSEYVKKCDAAIAKEKEEAEKAAKKAAEKKAAEQKEKGKKLIGTWYAKKVINYRDEDMTDQMDDLSKYYITFNEDGTGVWSNGDGSFSGGKYDFTWKIEDVEGYGDDAIGTWTVKGDTDTIFYYGDYVLIYTEEMSSIPMDMRYFCYK